LPTHNIIYFSIVFWILDLDLNGNLFKLYADNVLIQTFYGSALLGSSLTSYCGASLLADYPSKTVSGQISHSASSLTLQVSSQIGSTSTTSFGFRNIYFLFGTVTTPTTSVCQFSSSTLGSNSCLCSSGQYGNTGSFGCSSCPSTCTSCSAATSTQCTSCPSGSSYNGVSCFTCDSSCYQCNGTSATDCIACTSGQHLYWNNTCQSTCNSPLITTVQNGKQYCNQPCSSSQYYYWNSSCYSTCTSPLVSSTTSDGVQTCSLPCASSQYYNSSDGSCQSSCGSPLVTYTMGDLKICNQPCQPSSYYLYWNGSCYSDCTSPLITGTSNSVNICSLPCSSSQYYYFNNTCQTASCSSPLVYYQSGDLKTCNLPCPTGSYYCTNNATCSSSCPSPYIASTTGGVYTCSLPCLSTRYYNYDGTCQASCASPLVSIISGDLKICSLPCQTGEYLYWNNSCYSTCASPLISSTNSVVKTCSLPCAISEYYNFDGSCKTACNAPLVYYQSGDLKFCNLPCASGIYYYWNNGTCNTACPSPYILNVTAGVYSCALPCSTSQYYYSSDGSCQSSCPSPLVSIISGDLKICNRPCSSGYYYATNNDTCVPSCPSPYTTTTVIGVSTCSQPCPIGEYYYSDGTCLASCDFPLISITQSDSLQYCNQPCSSGYYLYWDETCQPGCSSPMVSGTNNTVPTCSLPCPITSDYLYSDGTCQTTCPSPYIVTNVSDINLCNGACPSGEYLYENGDCDASCSSPYKIDTSNGDDACLLPCDASEYYNYDGTCQPACYYPFVITISGSLRSCVYPCNTREYYYWNFTCSSSCESPLKKKALNGVDLCSLPCSTSSQYYYPSDGSCQSTCTSPYISISQGDLTLCISECDPGYYYSPNNDSCRSDCPSPYVPDTGGTAYTCSLPCASNNYYYPSDGTCDSTCDPPYVSSTQGDLLLCNLKCSSEIYYYTSDASCQSTCPSPYISSITNDFYTCSRPCSSTLFLNYDGTCQPSCDSPLVSSTTNSIKVCNLPCSVSSEYYNWDGTCQSSCDSPYIPTQQASLDLCNFPCADGDYLDWTNNCRSSCPSAFQVSLANNKAACSFHCENSYFLYWNNTCHPTCNSPYVQSTDSKSQLICSLPCASNQYYYQNTTCNTTCPSPYISQTLNSDLKLCSSPCDPSQYYLDTSHQCSSSCDSPSTSETSGILKICHEKSEDTQEEYSVISPSTNKAIDQATSATAAIASILSVANPTAVFIMALADLMKYIQYIDIEYSPKVESLFDNGGDLLSISYLVDYNISEALGNKAPLRPLPHIFEKRNCHSNFLVNLWDKINILLLCIVLGVILWPLQWIFHKLSLPMIGIGIEKVTPIFRWNFFLLFYFSIYDDLTLFGVLELRTLHFTSAAEVGSFIICLLMVAIGVSLLVKILIVCKKTLTEQIHDQQDKVKRKALIFNGNKKMVHPKQNKMEHLQEKWFEVRYESIKMMFEAYKSSSFIRRSFLFWFTIRIAVCYLIVATLFQYPILEMVLLTLINITMMTYVVVQRPMHEKLHMFEVLIFEVILFVVNIAVLCLTIIDKSQPVNSPTKRNLGQALVICNIIVRILTPILVIVSTVISCVEIWKGSREWRAKANKYLKRIFNCFSAEDKATVYPTPTFANAESPGLPQERMKGVRRQARKKQSTIAKFIDSIKSYKDRAFGRPSHETTNNSRASSPSSPLNPFRKGKRKSTYAIPNYVPDSSEKQSQFAKLKLHEASPIQDIDETKRLQLLSPGSEDQPSDINSGGESPIYNGERQSKPSRDSSTLFKFKTSTELGFTIQNHTSQIQLLNGSMGSMASYHQTTTNAGLAFNAYPDSARDTSFQETPRKMSFEKKRSEGGSKSHRILDVKQQPTSACGNQTERGEFITKELAVPTLMVSKLDSSTENFNFMESIQDLESQQINLSLALSKIKSSESQQEKEMVFNFKENEEMMKSLPLAEPVNDRDQGFVRNREYKFSTKLQQAAKRPNLRAVILKNQLTLEKSLEHPDKTPEFAPLKTTLKSSSKVPVRKNKVRLATIIEADVPKKNSIEELGEDPQQIDELDNQKSRDLDKTINLPTRSNVDMSLSRKATSKNKIFQVQRGETIGLSSMNSFGFDDVEDLTAKGLSLKKARSQFASRRNMEKSLNNLPEWAKSDIAKSEKSLDFDQIFNDIMQQGSQENVENQE